MDAYHFQAKSLSYRLIEHKILKHYNLGTASSSSLPGHLSEIDSGEYVITGTRKSLSFYLEIKKLGNGIYDLTCYPN